MAAGVIPAIRVRDMAAALDFYVDRLGFVLQRGGPNDDNCALTRGDARLMLEVAGDLFSESYNEAIRGRLGSASATALYIEADDLEALYARCLESGVEVADPLADRPWGQAEFTVADPEGQWLTFWRASSVGT